MLYSKLGFGFYGKIFPIYDKGMSGVNPAEFRQRRLPVSVGRDTAPRLFRGVDRICIVAIITEQINSMPLFQFLRFRPLVE